MRPFIAILLICAGPVIAQVATGSLTPSGTFDASGASVTRPIQSGAVDPSTCVAGKDLFVNTGGAQPVLKYCISTNTWETETSNTVAATLTNKTLTTPTIASFANATHGHTNAAGGGQLAEGALNLTDVTTANVSATAHGFAPKFPNDATKYLDGTGAYTVPAGTNVMGRSITVTRTSGTVLTVASDCSPTSLCNKQVTQTTYAFSASETCTISAGTGAVYLYIDAAGHLTAGHNVTLTCSGGITASSGITAYPNDVIKIWKWTATAGVWDASGGTDARNDQYIFIPVAGAEPALTPFGIGH